VARKDPALRVGFVSFDPQKGGNIMLPASNAWAFALAAFALIIIPGPSVLFVIGRSLSLGRRGGLLSLVGNALGMLPAIALVSLGVGTLVAESVVVFTVIKFAGAAYMIYLGVQAIRHRNAHVRTPDRQAVPGRSAIRLLGEGFVVGATNPKTLVFFVAILPQFVSYSSPAIPLQLALLGMIFFTIALLSDSVWALSASTARQWFAKDPKRISRMGAGGGVMMIGLGGALTLTGNKG
jgi:threonine/homoserine/homoserine lactone efflux protein